ncbi:hypothetical protein M419DRAFT_123643 [Trichoderma reesei RUT C-30]|uniref:Uncharacterized protein n=1 Tax=Hypocrea jecorina (strain ATCC 56765 / BCRC 32924 / NRRL 11460 / Rut C-30) TaxID=1344414 RepID=A0A024S9F3_HYPJR|nr:hypothetical protein M419DRAFT_123643 [Trichoderma reesei RUT C-30]
MLSRASPLCARCCGWIARLSRASKTRQPQRRRGNGLIIVAGSRGSCLSSGENTQAT